LADVAALANRAVAGQGIGDLRAVLCGAVLLAHQRPKQNEHVPGGVFSVREGRGHGMTWVCDHTGGPYDPEGAENAVGDDARCH
jgi:hypothetical protein